MLLTARIGQGNVKEQKGYYMKDIDCTPCINVIGKDCYMHLELAEDYGKFCRILLKTDFENYSTELYNKLYWVRHGMVGLEPERYRKGALKLLQLRLDVAETLLMFRQGKGHLTISSAKTSKKLPFSLSWKMEELIEQQYKVWYLLGPTPMTEEELEEYNRTGLLKRDDITIEQITNRIKELKKEMEKYSKKGAPVRNVKLKAALLVFLEFKEKLSSKDYRTIFECCDHFGLIDKEVKEGWHESNKYPEVSYISSILRNLEKNTEVIFDFTR